MGFLELAPIPRRSIVVKSSIEWDRYAEIWRGWCRDWKQYIRWGQHLANQLNLTEEQAPGLFYAKTVKEANEIFWKYFRAD